MEYQVTTAYIAHVNNNCQLKLPSMHHDSDVIRKPSYELVSLRQQPAVHSATARKLMLVTCQFIHEWVAESLRSCSQISRNLVRRWHPFQLLNHFEILLFIHWLHSKRVLRREIYSKIFLVSYVKRVRITIILSIHVSIYLIIHFYFIVVYAISLNPNKQHDCS